MFLLVCSSPPIAWIRSWLKTSPPNTPVGPGSLKPAFSNLGLSECTIPKWLESARLSIKIVQSRSLSSVNQFLASEPNTTRLPSSVGSRSPTMCCRQAILLPLNVSAAAMWRQRVGSLPLSLLRALVCIGDRADWADPAIGTFVSYHWGLFSRPPFVRSPHAFPTSLKLPERLLKVT